MRHTIGFFVALAFGLLMVPLAADAQPAEKPREQLIGTWQLVSNPYWPDAVGRLMYAADGQMCLTLMRPDRLKFSTPTPLGGSTAEERAAAAAGYVNYCGAYHVNDEKGIVTDRIALSLFPNWVGTEQMTFISVSGNQLTRRGGCACHRVGTPEMRRSEVSAVLLYGFEQVNLQNLISSPGT